MCTVTVYRKGDLLRVTMNRDELRSRAPEVPPEAGPGWVGPRDGERGGTWFGLSEHGLVGCLLNAYPPDHLPALLPDPGLPSRGFIVPRILEGESLPELGRYPPFTLLLADRARTRLFRHPEDVWEELTGEWTMVASSGLRDGVRWREQQFEAWLAQGAPELNGVPAFHTWQVKGKEALGPLVSHPYSTTRSLTQAELVADAIRLRYWRTPDLPPEEPTSLVIVGGTAG